MRARAFFFFYLLLVALLTGCAGKQPSSLPSRKDEEKPAQAAPRITDPAGPIPTPSLPPDLARMSANADNGAQPPFPRAGGDSAAPAQPAKSVPYTVVCVIRQQPENTDILPSEGAGEGQPSPASGEKAGQKPVTEGSDPSVLIAAFEKTSLLHRLANKPPETLTGLEQRLSVALGEARGILNSYGYYSGKVWGKIEPAGGQGTISGRGSRSGPEGEPAPAEQRLAPTANAQSPAPKAPLSGESPASRNNEAVVVRVTFMPGPQYRMGATKVIAAVPDETPEGAKPLPRSLADVNLPAGAPAVAADVLAAVDRAREAFLENGYPFAAITSTRYTADHETRTLEAELRIEPGTFVRMGEVERHGAPSVKPGYVEAMRNWKLGRPWSQSRVEAFQDGLRQSGLFQSITVAPGERDDAHGSRPVVTTLEGAFERTMGGAVKYHSDFGPGIQAYWEHRNFTGHGDSLRISMPLWLDMQEITATYRRPFFLRRDQDFIANAAFLNQDTDAYSLTSAAAAAGFDRRLTRTWTASLKGSAEGGTIKEPDKERREYSMYGIPLGLAYNSANNLLDATSGSRVIISLIPYTGEYDGPFTVLRSRADAQTFIPLAKEDAFVLALRGSLGTVFGASAGQIPPSARFYSGGGGSVRGYEYQSLGPRDDDNKPLGGNSLVEASAEGRWRFTKEWGLVAFLDGGTVFDSAPGQSSDSLNEDIRWGAGLGLRYYTAIGPVRVDIATPLNPRSDDAPLQFYISIGQSF